MPFKESQLATSVLFFQSISYNVKIKMCSHPCHPRYTIHASHPCHQSHPSQPSHPPQISQLSYSSQSFQSSQSSSVIVSHPQSSLVISVIPVILVTPVILSHRQSSSVISSHSSHPFTCRVFICKDCFRVRGHTISILRKYKNELLDIAFKTLCHVTFSMLVYKCRKIVQTNRLEKLLPCRSVYVSTFKMLHFVHYLDEILFNISLYHIFGDIQHTRNVIKCSTEVQPLQWTAYFFKCEICQFGQTWLDKLLQEMILQVHFENILLIMRISIANKDIYYEFKPISIQCIKYIQNILIYSLITLKMNIQES